jgi:hypothetical protein
MLEHKKLDTSFKIVGEDPLALFYPEKKGIYEMEDLYKYYFSFHPELKTQEWTEIKKFLATMGAELQEAC